VGLWTRNLQLATFSIICSIVPLLVSKDGEKVLSYGFFHGYTMLTWSCIAMNAFGGLLVGAVINYCDAIMKDIAIGASIVVSAIGSMYLFDFQPQAGFTMGVVLVSYAVPLYAGRVGNVCSFSYLLTASHDLAASLAKNATERHGASGGSEKEKLVDLEMTSSQNGV